MMRKFILLVLISGAIALSFTERSYYDCSSCHKTLYDSTYNGGDIIRLPAIRFDLNKCTFLPDKDSVFNQSDTLKPVVKFINEHPIFSFELRVHSDTVNPYSATKLTQCRAKSITDRLIELGVDRNRIVARGMGESEPLRLDHTLHLPSGDSVTQGAVLTHKFIATKKGRKADWEYLRMQNRRTDLKIIQVEVATPVDTTKHSGN